MFFLQKAKIHHPDAAANTNPSTSNSKECTSSSTDNRIEWVKLLNAYQILIDSRSRQLYDLSRSTSSSSFLRQAAASGVKDGIHEDAEIDLNWNIGAWKKHNQKGGQEEDKNSANKNILDHLRGNLESDFQIALRHAYLGPRLDDLEQGQLPDTFEADERATASTDEVLQLVVGRRELGRVKLRSASLLSESERKAWLGQGQCTHREVRKDLALLAAFEATEELLEAPSSMSDLSNDKDGSSRQPTIENDESNTSKQPQILDLYLDGEVIATAISRPVTATAIDTDSTTTTNNNNATAGVDSIDDDDEIQNDSIHGVLTTYFYRGDTLLAQLIEEEASLATTRRYSASKLLDSSGNHIFSIIRNVTPLVRHITFVAEHSSTTRSTNNSTTGTGTSSASGVSKRKKTVVARAQRAWLPPSTFWLFKPRSYDHDIGGWVINWAGESQRSHPQWLDPSICTLVAALDTLDYEKAKQQPYGLFERVKKRSRRESQEEGSTFGGEGDCKGGKARGSKVIGSSGSKKVLEWVRDMLRFHQGGK